MTNKTSKIATMTEGTLKEFNKVQPNNEFQTRYPRIARICSTKHWSKFKTTQLRLVDDDSIRVRVVEQQGDRLLVDILNPKAMVWWGGAMNIAQNRGGQYGLCSEIQRHHEVAFGDTKHKDWVGYKKHCSKAVAAYINSRRRVALVLIEAKNMKLA